MARRIEVSGGGVANGDGVAGVAGSVVAGAGVAGRGAIARPTSSPCVGVCRIEAGSCAGCGRTLAEVVAWGDLDDEARGRVLARLARTPRGEGRSEGTATIPGRGEAGR